MTQVLPEIIPLIPELIPELPPHFLPFLPPPPHGHPRVQVLPTLLRFFGIKKLVDGSAGLLNDLLRQIESPPGSAQPPGGLDTVAQVQVWYLQHAERLSTALWELKGYTFTQLQNLAQAIEAEHVTVLNQLGGIYLILQGILNGTIPVAQPATGLQPAPVEPVTLPQLQPLIDNLGKIGAQVDLLTQTVGTLQAQLSPEALRQKIGIPDASAIPTLLAILAPVTALIAANLPTRMVTAEECCAANTQQVNKWKPNMNELQKLLDLFAGLFALYSAQELINIVTAFLSGEGGTWQHRVEQWLAGSLDLHGLL